MAMNFSIAQILNRVDCSNFKTNVYAHRSNFDIRIARPSLDIFLCSKAKLKDGVFGSSGQRWNPLLNVSRNVSRKAMRIRGSQIDYGVADSGLIPQNADTSKATSALDNLLDSNSVQGSSSSKPSLPILPNTPRSIAQRIEDAIEKAIIDCRFLTLFGVVGSLLGSMLCFLQGSLYVAHSFKEYVRAYTLNVRSSQVILYLVEAVDVYLMGTVMLIFGMGLYELFVSSFEVPDEGSKRGAAITGQTATSRGSNLFGLFTLEERPKWLEIRSLDELKTKLGHVIVMILLVGMFEKSKRVPIHTGMDLLFFSGSILLASICLYLLANLHSNNGHGKGH